jgi:hypothetical protein
MGLGYEQAIAELFELAGVSVSSLAARLRGGTGGQCRICGGLESIVDPSGSTRPCPHCSPAVAEPRPTGVRPGVLIQGSSPGQIVDLEA